jgi:outer membrane autotransporter protein
LTPFQGSAHGLGWNVYGDAGYRFQLPTTLGAAYVKPFVGLNYSSLDRSASTEFSGGGLALNYGAQTFNRFSSLLGVDFFRIHLRDRGRLHPAGVPAGLDP